MKALYVSLSLSCNIGTSTSLKKEGTSFDNMNCFYCPGKACVQSFKLHLNISNLKNATNFF